MCEVVELENKFMWDVMPALSVIGGSDFKDIGENSDVKVRSWVVQLLVSWGDFRWSWVLVYTKVCLFLSVETASFSSFFLIVKSFAPLWKALQGTLWSSCKRRLMESTRTNTNSHLSRCLLTCHFVKTDWGATGLILFIWLSNLSQNDEGLVHRDLPSYIISSSGKV